MYTFITNIFLGQKKGSITSNEPVISAPVRSFQKKLSISEAGSKGCSVEDFRLVSVLGRGHFGKVVLIQ
jgi:hypothetical protein